MCLRCFTDDWTDYEDCAEDFGDEPCQICDFHHPIDFPEDQGRCWEVDLWLCRSETLPSFCKKEFKDLVRHDRLGCRIDPYFGLSAPWEPEHLRCLSLGRLWSKTGLWIEQPPVFSDREIISFGA